MTCRDVKPLLNAHFDSEIDTVTRTFVDSHIAACPSCSAELMRLEAIRGLIRREVAREAPPHLRDEIWLALRGVEYIDGSERKIEWRRWRTIAAVIALVAVGLGPLLVHTRDHEMFIAREILSAHQRALIAHPIDIASSDQHTVKPWFNGKIPYSPPVADLATQGYPLAGGRLDYIGGHPTVSLVYRRRKHLIDVFVWPAASAELPPRQFGRDGYNEISWEKNDFVFTAISDLNATELKSFARLLQTY
jgi:anti-sigma factor RsiW